MSQVRQYDCQPALREKQDEQTTCVNGDVTAPLPPYSLHSSVVNKLAPDYVAFYNKYLLNIRPVHFQSLAVARAGGLAIPGPSENLPVGKIQDYSFERVQTTGSAVRVRCFTPEGEPSCGRSRWPVMIYYHGGGWALGDITSESQVCTNMCVRAKCVVITTEYRLAPEHPYPAALHDCWETLLWTVSKGVDILNLDITRIAIGGASAGANLAAAMTQRALLAKEHQPRNSIYDINFVLQLLVVPITDNTATVDTNPTWRQYEHTAALPATKMLWYRKHYLPDPATWKNPDASPLLFPADRFSELPPAVILVGEVDLLRHEAQEYARKLIAAGVSTKVEIFRGMPHPFLSMDAVLEEGKRAITQLCDGLVTAFA